MIVAALVGALAAGGPQLDTSTYRDAATAGLMARARARHERWETSVSGYSAEIHSVMEGRVAASRFADGFRVLAHETVARLTWRYPNDLRVDLVGARGSVPRFPGVSRHVLEGWFAELVTQEPWFSPTAFGDEIQILGLPDEAALHPLARRAPRFYRYAVTDSTTLELSTRRVRAIAVEVRPRMLGPTLVSGTLWIDADSLDLVRLSVVFVGEHIWEDDHEAPELRHVEADLEFALVDGRYWLPHRQILSTEWRYRYLPGAAMPATAVTTFSKHRIEGADPVQFTSRSAGRWGFWCDPWAFSRRPNEPDCRSDWQTSQGQWEGGDWQIIVPPADLLAKYDFGTPFGSAILDEAQVGRRLAELARRSEQLPAAWSRERRLNVDWQRVLGAFGFNRVQGPSIGWGVVWRPGAAFLTVHASARLSAADRRVTGGLAVRRDAPDQLLSLSLMRGVTGVEPWARGMSTGGSLKALLAGHDDADYGLVSSANLDFAQRRGALRGVALALGVERHRSLGTLAGSSLHDVFFGDGVLGPNPSVLEGDFGRFDLSRALYWQNVTVRLGTGGLFGRRFAGGRAWGVADAVVMPTGLTGRLRGRIGSTMGDRAPQLDFRLGGPETVRGYPYGARVGATMWSVQSELELSHDPWIVPVLFADAGGLLRSEAGGPGAMDPMIGGGIGLSLLNGWLRLDCAKGFHPNAGVRCDALVRVPA